MRLQKHHTMFGPLYSCCFQSAASCRPTIKQLIGRRPSTARLHQVVNPLDYRHNYSASSNNMKLVHWPLMGGLLHLVQRGGVWAGCGPAQTPPRCTKCNSPPINGQCPITVLLYDGPLHCGFNVPIKR